MRAPTVIHADSREALKGLADNSIDSVVCDPPYALTSINKRFGKTPRTPSTMPKSGPHARASSGFMGVSWDTGETAFDPDFWAEVLRVLKPGGYCVAFSSSRTGHWLACAMELAGFVMHPMLGWIFGSGFPKAHDAAKAIDKALGKKGAVAASGKPVRRIRPGADQNKDGSWEKLADREYQPGQYVPATDEAAQWQGWAYGGQATKPALEPIYVGQKPFSEANGALNILKWGTGALNIDGCRIPHESADDLAASLAKNPGRDDVVTSGVYGAGRPQQSVNTAGRWPANLLHDGSDEVIAAFPDTGVSSGGKGEASQRTALAGPVYGDYSGKALGANAGGLGDEGSAARFFYAAKAGPYDRFASKHPTVKPVELMRWLVRLVTPPGGTVLDPFAGTGTTGAAAMVEGFDCILIEREAEFSADIERRIAWMKGDGPLTAQAISREEQAEVSDLPLFSGDAA